MGELEARLKEVVKPKEADKGKGDGQQERTLSDALKEHRARLMDGLDAESVMTATEQLREQRLAIQSRNARLAAGQDGGNPAVTLIDPQHDSMKKILDAATDLANRGVKPEIIGEVIRSALQGVPGVLPYMAPATGSQGSTVKELTGAMKDMLEMIESRRPKEDGANSKVTDALKAVLDEFKALRAEVDQLKNKPEPLSPAEELKRRLDFEDAVEQWAAKRGWTKEMPASGEDIEALKEKNRHDEEMKRLQDEGDHKKNMGALAGNALETVGGGVAQYFFGPREEKPGARAESAGLHTFPCGNCQHKIVIPPNAQGLLRCGKCGEKQFPCPQCSTGVIVPPGEPDSVKCGKCGHVWPKNRSVEQPPNTEKPPAKVKAA